MNTKHSLTIRKNSLCTTHKLFASIRKFISEESNNLWVITNNGGKFKQGLSIHKNLRNSSIFNMFKIVNSASTNFDRNGVRIKLFLFSNTYFPCLND